MSARPTPTTIPQLCQNALVVGFRRAKVLGFCVCIALNVCAQCCQVVRIGLLKSFPTAQRFTLGSQHKRAWKNRTVGLSAVSMSQAFKGEPSLNNLCAVSLCAGNQELFVTTVTQGLGASQQLFVRQLGGVQTQLTLLMSLEFPCHRFLFVGTLSALRK